VRALPNPHLTFGRCFGDDFPVGTASVFVDFFWANRGCGRFWIHASPLKVVLMTFSESTGSVSASESTRHLWKVFWRRFSSWYRLCLCWLFLSQQGMAALLNPPITFERCLGDDFGVDNDFVFVDYLWVNNAWGRWQIHASPLEVVSLTFSELTGAASASESTRHLWKVFRWWFSSRQRLCFRGLFLSPQWCELFRIYASPLEGVSVMISSRRGLRFHRLFLSLQGLWAILNPRVAFGSCFVDFLWVNRVGDRFQIHASPLKSVSATIFQLVPTPFLLTFRESTGDDSSFESALHL